MKESRSFIRKKVIIIAALASVFLIAGIYGSIVIKFYSGITEVVPEEEVDVEASDTMMMVSYNKTQNKNYISIHGKCTLIHIIKKNLD